MKGKKDSSSTAVLQWDLSVPKLSEYMIVDLSQNVDSSASAPLECPLSFNQCPACRSRSCLVHNSSYTRKVLDFKDGKTCLLHPVIQVYCCTVCRTYHARIPSDLCVKHPCTYRFLYAVCRYYENEGEHNFSRTAVKFGIDRRTVVKMIQAARKDALSLSVLDLTPQEAEACPAEENLRSGNVFQMAWNLFRMLLQFYARKCQRPWFFSYSIEVNHTLSFIRKKFKYRQNLPAEPYYCLVIPLFE